MPFLFSFNPEFALKEACSSGRIFDIAKRRLKDVYDIIPSTESVRNLVPSLKTVGWIAVGTGATYIAANRGFTGANNSSNAVNANSGLKENRKGKKTG